MPRPLRLSPPGLPQHVVQRGNNRCACFVTNADRAAYLARLHDVSQRLEVAVHSYILMHNHVHLLVTPARAGGVSRMMHMLGSWYVRYFNRTHGRSGTLWEGRFWSCVIQSPRFFFAVSRYIELNPVRAGMVAHPGDYVWSSYRMNALGYPIKLLTPHAEYLGLGPTPEHRQDAYRRLFSHDLSQDELAAIRRSRRLSNGPPAAPPTRGGDRRSSRFRSRSLDQRA